MHRQSLGSPNSKLHSSNTHGPLIASKQDITIDLKNLEPLADDEVRKWPKSPERLIHLIPVVIIICFLILYLSSHDPFRKEISSEIEDFGRSLNIEKSAIRSLKKLQENNRLHRKIIGYL